MGKIYQVVVDGPKGEKITIDLCNTEEQMQSMTVLQLKKKILPKLSGVEGGALRMIFADKALDDDSDLLSKYGIQHRSVILVVLKLPGGLTTPQRPPPPATSTAVAAASYNQFMMITCTK